MSANNIKSIKFSKPGKYAVWQVASLITAGILGCGALLTFFFIYQNIYATLSEADVIMVLASNMNLDLLDLNAYNNINKIIAQKKKPIEIPQNLKNIFIYETAAATSTMIQKK